MHTLKGSITIFEYACSKSSILGERCEALGVECIRLSRDIIDLADPDQVSQLVEQVSERPGADLWLSLPCTDYTQWQHMNASLYGEMFQKKLKERRKKSKKIFKLFEQVAERILQEGGRIAIEWPANSGLFSQSILSRLHARCQRQRASYQETLVHINL